MSDPDYRVQARAVRAAARQRIRELSLRRGTQVPRWQPAASAPEAETAMPQQAAAEPAAAPSATQPAAVAPEVDASPVTQVAAAPAPEAPEAGTPAPGEPSAQRNPPQASRPQTVPPPPPAPDTDDESDAEADGHDLSVMTVSLAAAALANRAAGRPADAESVSLADSDLARLPGVGPGLVWLLGQAGVSDCTALIRSDPAALADRLGVVGQLIEITGLQALAARHANAPAAAARPR